MAVLCGAGVGLREMEHALWGNSPKAGARRLWVLRLNSCVHSNKEGLAQSTQSGGQRASCKAKDANRKIAIPDLMA